MPQVAGMMIDPAQLAEMLGGGQERNPPPMPDPLVQALELRARGRAIDEVWNRAAKHPLAPGDLLVENPELPLRGRGPSGQLIVARFYRWLDQHDPGDLVLIEDSVRAQDNTIDVPDCLMHIVAPGGRICRLVTYSLNWVRWDGTIPESAEERPE